MNMLTVLVSAAATFGLVVPSERTRDLEHHAVVTPAQKLEIRGLSGSHLEFRSWDKNEVSIRLRARIASSDEEYEEEYINSLEIAETRTASALVLEFRETTRSLKGSGFWSIFTGGAFVKKELRGEVYVPRSNALTLDFRHGSIALEDMRGELNIRGKNNTLSLKNCLNVRTVENDYGTSEIRSSGGALELDGTSSTITIAAFKGTVAVNAPYSTIRISDLTGSGIIKSKSGKIAVENAGAGLAIEAEYSTVTAADIGGPLSVTTKSGTVRVRKVRGLAVDAPYSDVEASEIDNGEQKDVILTNQSGSIALEKVKGNVVLDCPYTGVDLREIDGSVTVRSKSSTIRADGVGGDWKSETEYCTLRLRALRPKQLIADNKSGLIHVEALSVPERVELRNEYGNVEIEIPKGFSGAVDLDAEYGTVETDLPLNVRKRASSAYAVGTVGSGSGSILIHTRSGNIRLEQSR